MVNRSLIQTIDANCRDCYKCVRSCPVKAIKVTGGHTEVFAELCIHDGRCVTVCPQKAKKVESSVETLKELLNSGRGLAASIAPSFLAAFEYRDPGQIVAALKKLGFSHVSETAEGAELVAREHWRLAKAGTLPLITSCCPVVVNLIEIYYPHLLKFLAPVISPMVAHGQILKKRYGQETKVIFIGPCYAKKGELFSREGAASIDLVLTFEELAEVLESAGIRLTELSPAGFDGPGACKAHLFPLPGGLAKTVSLSTDLLGREAITVDGLDEVSDFLHNFNENQDSLFFVELLACRGGCLSGPGLAGRNTFFRQREQLMDYSFHQSKQEKNPVITDPGFGLERSLSSRAVALPEISEEKIQEILSLTGKTRPEDELNCGACGYNTCRDKAKAEILGMAEVEMCIPFMRKRAESRANIICQMTPNAIIVVDSDLKILEVNPAMEGKFRCSQKTVAGKELSVVINPHFFEEALRTKEIVTGEITFSQYGITAWQAIFYVAHEDVVIGIFADITKEKQQIAKLAQVKAETLEKAQEVINKQMRVAQEIAGLLGETTAETKVLLTKLMGLIQKEEGKS